MNTLEKMIEKELIGAGYLAPTALVHEAAVYIDGYNEANPEEFYSVEDWILDTEQSFPEDLIKRDSVLFHACDDLVKQREECLDQTGCEPHWEDFKQYTECEEWHDKFGDVTISQIMNFLVRYYDSEGNIDA